jgi:hypothetical protein
LDDVQELVLVDLISPFGLPQLVDPFNGLCQSVVGLLIHLDFLDVVVFVATFEGGYVDIEGLSRGPRGGGAGVRAGPGVTRLWGDTDEIANGGNGGFLKFTISSEGGVKGWGCGEASFLFNETGQEISELIGGGFSAWIDHSLGYAQEIGLDGRGHLDLGRPPRGAVGVS